MSARSQAPKLIVKTDYRLSFCEALGIPIIQTTEVAANGDHIVNFKPSVEFTVLFDPYSCQFIIEGLPKRA